MADNEFNGYQEKSERFRFDEEGSLTIPKGVRELAYHISIDIEILSIARQAYLNYKSIPAHSFYGYVIIVLRDMSLIKIPIENSRQRLWTDIIHSAFANWYALYLQFKNLQFLRRNNSYLVLIASQLGIAPIGGLFECPITPSFVETEIRELYIKSAYGTRFAVEVNWWEPIPVKYGDCEYDGKSGQIDDPQKDRGLPNKSQPAIASDPNNPYDGYSPPTSSADKTLPSGDWNNTKDLDGLDEPNPDNEPEYDADTDGVWVIKISFTPPNTVDGCGILRGEGETRTYSGKYGDTWTFPNCNAREGLNGFCLHQNGIYKSESYVCNGVTVVFDSIEFFTSV
jgi:hypothetical protein